MVLLILVFVELFDVEDFVIVEVIVCVELDVFFCNIRNICN